MIDLVYDDLTPVNVGTFIIEERKKNGGYINPDIAIETLMRSNHYANIKFLIKEIYRLPEEERKQFEYFVVEAVNGRETSEKCFEELQKLAREIGCIEIFDEVNARPKRYKYDDCGLYTVFFPEELKNILGIKKNILADFKNIENVELYFCDLKGVNRFIFKKGSIVSFGKEFFTFDVTSEGAYNFPKKMDVSDVHKFFADKCDFNGTEDFIINKTNLISLKKIKGDKKLPKNIVISDCNEVYFNWSDFDGVESLKLNKVHMCNFDYATTLPEVLDLSDCDEVYFTNCDLTNVKEIKFKKGAFAYFCKATLPNGFDLSMCDDVDISYIKMDDVSTLKLNPDSDIALANGFWNGVLDLSECKSLRVTDCGTYVPQSMYKFKNKMQARNAGFKCDCDKFVFVENAVEATFNKVKDFINDKRKR